MNPARLRQMQPALGERSPKATLIRALDGIGEAMSRVAVAIVALLAFPICYDVVARAIGRPTIWVFEITLYALGAGAFLANAAALKHGTHFRITILVKLFPRWRNRFDQLALLATLAFGLVLAVSGAMFAWQSFSEGVRSATLLSIPLFIPQSELALGGIALVVQSLSMLLAGSEPAPDEQGVRNG
jgi:TRAP-type C4-dicarboxylate transport system permease small subunit